jgi:hypothetical protein
MESLTGKTAQGGKTAKDDVARQDPGSAGTQLGFHTRFAAERHTHFLQTIGLRNLYRKPRTCYCALVDAGMHIRAGLPSARGVCQTSYDCLHDLHQQGIAAVVHQARHGR